MAMIMLRSPHQLTANEVHARLLIVNPLVTKPPGKLTSQRAELASPKP